MARKRVTEPPLLKTWEDVNDALREIAEAQIALNDIEGEMQKQIVGAKKIAEQEGKPHADRIAKLEREIKKFAEEHRDDFGKKKTMSLTFGDIGFRLSTSITISSKPDKLAEIIRKLRARKLFDCVVVKESVNKENLRKYGKETVIEVGGVWREDETFGYDVNLAKLEQIKAGN